MATPSAAERAAANAIYNVLVAQAGASDTDSMRRQFEHFYPKRADLAEFRFMGLLGFGGKIWWSSHHGWHVNSGRSDAEAIAVIERTNAVLERFNTERQQSHKS